MVTARVARWCPLGAARRSAGGVRPGYRNVPGPLHARADAAGALDPVAHRAAHDPRRARRCSWSRAPCSPRTRRWCGRRCCVSAKRPVELAAEPVTGEYEPMPPPGPAQPLMGTAAFTLGTGFWNAVEVSRVGGEWGMPGPADMWLRLTVPIVAGEVASPFQRRRRRRRLRQRHRRRRSTAGATRASTPTSPSRSTGCRRVNGSGSTRRRIPSPGATGSPRACSTTSGAGSVGHPDRPGRGALSRPASVAAIGCAVYRRPELGACRGSPCCGGNEACASRSSCS